MPANLEKRFGSYERDAAVWNDAEGWVYTNGVWHPVDSFTLMQEASPLSEAAFRRFFPKLHELPRTAFKS